MTLLDYIIFGIAAICLVVGLFKGILKQIFGLVGIILVAIGTAYLYVFPFQWMEGVITDEGTRQLVALILTLVVLAVIVGTVNFFIIRLITKKRSLKVLDRILGMVLSVGIVYVLVGILVSLLLNTQEGFLPLTKNLLGQVFADSWCVKNIYANNFIGDWIVGIIAQQMQPVPV